jgi:hypothetical protein
MRAGGTLSNSNDGVISSSISAPGPSMPVRPGCWREKRTTYARPANALFTNVRDSARRKRFGDIMPGDNSVSQVLDQRLIMPCFIPAFNNPTYVRGILTQLSRFPGLKPVILDNASSYGPLLDLYAEVDAGRWDDARVIRLGCNAGPRAVWYNLTPMPRYFCITDPDLEFNENLPTDFLSYLMMLTETYTIGKAGFALSLDDKELMLENRFRHCEGLMTIREAEARHWQVALPPVASPGDRTSDPLYYATIDTTFALYNKKYFDPDNPFDAVRVAGRYACRHLPWYKNNGLSEDEEAFYRRSTEFSYYMGDRPALQVRKLFAHQDALSLNQHGRARLLTEPSQ